MMKTDLIKNLKRFFKILRMQATDHYVGERLNKNK